MRYLKSNNLFVECFIKCFDVINGVKFIDGGLPLDQARIFKELEKENIWLKRLLADLSLDKAILKDAASENL
jgi:hypothetical protein